VQIYHRRPVFDQLIVNRYLPGEGILPHVDLARFEDGIAIVSLGSAAVMEFTLETLCQRVLLSPGDVLMLTAEARLEMKFLVLKEWYSMTDPGYAKLALRLR
jgi:alkylated DNA repair dioxygenase AlkB